jgi:hypothetical protein
MNTVEFTSEEMGVLQEVLQSEMREIDGEVLLTDSHEFKEMPKRRRGVLANLITKLSGIQASA